jgi:hypothetical protein
VLENDVAGRARAVGAREDGEEVRTSSPPSYRRTCAVCSEGVAEVLLLLCCHLCAEAAKAWRARAFSGEIVWPIRRARNVVRCQINGMAMKKRKI